MPRYGIRQSYQQAIGTRSPQSPRMCTILPDDEMTTGQSGLYMRYRAAKSICTIETQKFGDETRREAELSKASLGEHR